MTLVPPDGPVPCRFAVVGEAPASEEVRQGKGFVGPSGALLWPLMRHLALLNRSECYVDNLCQHPLDNDVDGDAKLSAEEFIACRTALWSRLTAVRPERILAVGALAAKALLGDRYTTMDVCNGIGFEMWLDREAGCFPTVVPTWHPAAALRPGGEDRLAYTGAAIAALREPRICPTVPAEVPEACIWTPRRATGAWGLTGPFGCDTEGTPDDPICMTVSTVRGPRWFVDAADVPAFFASGPDPSMHWVFHNAPWDWAVLRAMGAPPDFASRWRWSDTMELAYLRQTEPRGLKALGYRHLGLRMRSFEDVVQPHYDMMLRSVAEGLIAAHTTNVTVSPKGRLLKRPRVVLDDSVKPLKRALANPKLLAERMPGLPPATLRLVPKDELVEYATLDAWVTVKLFADGVLA